MLSLNAVVAMKKLYDPIKLSKATELVVVRGERRKYYRVARGGKWYGGIATADCCGCNLRCIYCWSGEPRDHPERVGRFYTPEEIFKALDQVARRRGYHQVRVSGNEPTIGRDHLLKLLDLVDQTNYTFILETNGILIGHDKSYAHDLAKYRCLHVRVSIKAATPQQFSQLTGAVPEGFELQLKALEHLVDAGVPCHPAVMLSFSTKGEFKQLVARIVEIEPSLLREIEAEYVFLYPHVAERLKKAGIKPYTAFTPDNIPAALI